jgi:hypothetical protein
MTRTRPHRRDIDDSWHSPRWTAQKSSRTPIWHMRANHNDEPHAPRQPHGRSGKPTVLCGTTRIVISSSRLPIRPVGPVGASPDHTRQSATGETHVTSAANRFVRSGDRRRGAAAAASVSTLLLVAVGCSSADPKATPTTAPTTASGNPTQDPTATAKSQLLAVYQKMTAIEDQMYAAGAVEKSDLEKYAGDKALSNIKTAAFYYQQNGIKLTGSVQHSPRVSAISVAKQPFTATIVDCLDSSKTAPVYKANGKPVPLADKNRRHISTSTAQTIDGVWKIMNLAIDRDRTC